MNRVSKWFLLLAVVGASTLPIEIHAQETYGMFGLGYGTFECTDDSCESFNGIAGYVSFGKFLSGGVTYGLDVSAAYKSESGVSLYTFVLGPSVGLAGSFVHARASAGLGGATVSAGGMSETGYSWGASAEVGLDVPMDGWFLSPYAAYGLLGSDRAIYQLGIAFSTR